MGGGKRRSEDGRPQLLAKKSIEDAVKEISQTMAGMCFGME
jgi:hypothetical protein